MGFTTYGYRSQSESAIDNEIPLYLSGQNKQAISRVAPGEGDGGLDMYADELRTEHANGKIFRAGYGPAGSPTWVFDLTSTGVGLTGATIEDATLSGDVYRNGMIVRPEDFGARADFMHFGGASISAGSQVLTLPATPYPVTELMACCVQGAGVAGADLITTVEEVLSPTQVRLVVAASTSVPGAVVELGTDNAAPFNAAWQQLLPYGGVIELHGSYMAGRINWTRGHGMAVRGVCFPGYAGTNPLNRGAQIMALPGLTGNWIEIGGGSGVVLEKLGIGRADQEDWSALPMTAIYCSSAAGVETTNYTFRDLYVAGTYSASTFYFNQMFEVVMERVFAYNYHAQGGRCVTLTANNRDNVPSGYPETPNHPDTSYIASGQFRARASQFNQVGWTRSGYNRTDYCMDIDSWFDIELEGCLWTGANRAIRIRDEATGPLQRTRTITLVNPTFENPGQSGALGMRGAFYLDGPTVTEDVTIDGAYFNLTDTVPQNAAWVEDGSSSTTATGIKSWHIRAPKSIAGTESAIILDKTSTGGTSRVTQSDIDVQARRIRVSGSLDFTNKIHNEGTVETPGGTYVPWSWTGGGPFARYGLMIGPRGLLDPNGAQVLALASTASAVNQVGVYNAAAGNPPKLAALGATTDLSLELAGQGTGAIKVPAFSSGTPRQNELYHQTLVKAWARLSCAAGTVSLVNGFNVSGTVTRSADGDYTVTLLRSFSGNEYAWSATPLSNNRLYACVTVASLAPNAVRVQVCDAAGAIVLPDGLFLMAVGVQA